MGEWNVKVFCNDRQTSQLPIIRRCVWGRGTSKLEENKFFLVDVFFCFFLPSLKNPVSQKVQSKCLHHCDESCNQNFEKRRWYIYHLTKLLRTPMEQPTTDLLFGISPKQDHLPRNLAKYKGLYNQADKSEASLFLGISPRHRTLNHWNQRLWNYVGWELTLGPSLWRNNKNGQKPFVYMPKLPLANGWIARTGRKFSFLFRVSPSWPLSFAQTPQPAICTVFWECRKSLFLIFFSP